MSETNDKVASDFNELSNLTILQNILLQMQKNLTLIEEGAVGKTLVVNGANLYQLAAQYYGDATQWATIADANGLTDPQIQPGTPITIIIPATLMPSGRTLI